MPPLRRPQGFFIIVYFMGGLRYNAGAFFGSYGTMLLTMLVAQVGSSVVAGQRCSAAL